MVVLNESRPHYIQQSSPEQTIQDVGGKEAIGARCVRFLLFSTAEFIALLSFIPLVDRYAER